MNKKNTLSTTAKAKTLLLSLALTAMTTGCSSTDDSNRVDRDNQNSLISQFYATVHSVNAVKLTSNADEGMVNGVFIGLIESLDGDSEDMLAGLIGGALIGGLFTTIAEGSGDAYQYHISSATHGEFSVVQEQQLPASATCVRVKSGNKVTLTPVDERFCQPSDQAH